MPRAKSSVPKKARHKKVLAKAKGYRGKRSKWFTIANQSVVKSGAFAFAGRKKKKPEYRQIWHVRIGAGLEGTGLAYSRFMAGLKKAGIALNRKILALLAAEDPETFKKLAEAAQSKAA